MNTPIKTLDDDALAELEQDLGEAFAQFLNSFLDAMPDALDAVDAALDAGDGATAAAHAHRMKGSAGYLGADALAASLGELQQAAEHGGHAQELAVRTRELFSDVAPLLAARAGHG